MKFIIPFIGQRLQLTKPWEFYLYFEHRNESMWPSKVIEQAKAFRTYFFGLPYTFNSARLADDKEYQQRKLANDKLTAPRLHTLPKGTLLVVDRLYIRQGHQDFSSVTFKMPSIKRGRFWVKLDDANNMEFKILPRVE